MTTHGPTSIDTVDDLFDRLVASAIHDDEEAVDLLQHGLQCAARLRAQSADDLELQVAGLVHDIGTAIEPDSPDQHARIGAAAIRTLLGPRVARLVAGHADAKRYLVAVDASYRAALSPRSIVTLAAQGGPLDERAAAAFARGRDTEALVTLRHADDAAKVAGADAGGLESWRPVVAAVVAGKRA